LIFKLAAERASTLVKAAAFAVGSNKKQNMKNNPNGNTQRGYNTNLASEFFVLSMLYRLGLDASLTLGNKKRVDISVVLDAGKAITIDVKAVAGKNDWLMGGVPESPKPNHYVILVSFEGRFRDATQLPRCWVLRHDEVLPLGENEQEPDQQAADEVSFSQRSCDQLRCS
jgi:hypothetical protein